MQPTFRQTPPSVGALVDQHDLLAEIGGPERRGIAAGTRADHKHLGMKIALRG